MTVPELWRRARGLAAHACRLGVLLAIYDEQTVPVLTIRPVFAWYDWWVGGYWDRTQRRLWLFPLPMFGILLQFRRGA